MCALCRYKKQFLFNKITTTIAWNERKPTHHINKPPPIELVLLPGVASIPSQQLHRSTTRDDWQVVGASTDAVVTLQVLAVLI